MRVAILEDDPDFCDDLAQIVLSLGHSVITANNGESMMSELRNRAVDFLLLDWELEGISGFDILKWARETLKPVPHITMISIRQMEGDVVAALSAGADDYITKPVTPAILEARLFSKLRRSKEDRVETTHEHYGPYTFDLEEGCVTVGGRVVDTSPIEFRLALYLFRNLNRSSRRQEIIQLVWGPGADTESRSLDTYIRKLRTRLELDASRGYSLKALYREGYRLEELPGRHSNTYEDPAGLSPKRRSQIDISS